MFFNIIFIFPEACILDTCAVTIVGVANKQGFLCLSAKKQKKLAAQTSLHGLSLVAEVVILLHLLCLPTTHHGDRQCLRECLLRHANLSK